MAPENTVASFQAALDAGVDAIECDVRVTQDGQVVMAHDKKVANPEGETAEVLNSTHAELKKHQPDLLTLEETIRFIDQRVPLYIEVKPGTPTAPIIEVMKKVLADKWQASDFQFVSFDYRILKALHQAFPDVGVIVNDMWSGVRATYRARKLGTKQIDLYTPFVWSGFVRGVSRRGYQLFVFPENNVQQARRWEKLGLAGVITDDPTKFKAAK